MAEPTQAQIDHINQHLDLFHQHAGSDRTPAEYLHEYAYYKDGDIYERLCHDLGIEPIKEGGPVTTETNDVERAQMMLTLGMNEEGNALDDQERATLQAFIDSQQPASASAQAPSTAQEPSEQVGAPDIQAMIQQEVAKMAAGLVPQAPAGIPDVETFLRATDPKDSDAALMMLQWLIDTGRMQNIGTINGGGYMFHYQEPKGTTKAGYTPGATKGGRMVDQALDEAKAAGAKPRKTGMCDQCWSAVEQQEDGTIVLDDDTRSSICSAGGKHTFNA